MGYYCRYCQHYHNTNTNIGISHRIYASQRPPRRRRRRRTIWEEIVRW